MRWIVVLWALLSTLTVACDWPLDARVELEKTQYLPGEPIVGTITLRNRAAHKVTAEFSDSCTFQVVLIRESTGEWVRMPDWSCLQLLGSYELDGREEMILATGLLLRTECSSSYCEPLTPGRYLLEVTVPVTNHRRPSATIPIDIIAPTN